MNIAIVIGGTAHSLTDGTVCYLMARSGWGMAPLHRIMERGPQQHGHTDVGFLHDPRIGMLKLGVPGVSMADLQERVARLIAWHKPRREPIALRWTLDDGAVRQIDAYYLDGIDGNSAAGLGFHREYTISYECPSAFFYDPVAIVESFGISAGAEGWAIPWSIPWSIGGSTLDHTKAIHYPGTALTYPVIRIYGPIIGPVITNETTGEQIAFKDTTELGAGEWYEIDLRYGYKTVKDQDGAAQDGELDHTVQNDIATFHLEADPDVPSGINVIRVTGTGASAGTQVRLTYNARYLGIY